MNKSNTAIATLTLALLISIGTILSLTSMYQTEKREVTQLQKDFTKAKNRADFYQWRDQTATGHTTGPDSYKGEWRP